ncbi:pilus assembly protein [Escherichia coli]|nr:pilus assembly protein [Escherichia coli]
MAFKIWQIGLHLQQQEAVAVAIVRGAKECFLQRWWRLPLAHDIIKDGGLLMRSGWLKRCYRGVANCRSAITSCWRSRQSHITAVISAPVDVPR